MHRKEELTLVFILDAIGVDAVLQRVQSVISSLAGC
jgi:hypothetical protein